MKPDSQGVQGNEEAQRKLGLFNETYRKGILAMNAGKNWPIQAKRQGSCSASPLELSVATVEKEGCLDLKALGMSLYLLLNLSSGLKTTLSIIPIASKSLWEKSHG